LKYLPQPAVSNPEQIFNVHRIHHFPQCESTLEVSASLNRGRIRHCPILSGH
jgi:hypothetical protein